MPNVTIIEPADLTPTEAERLDNLETVISSGMRSFVEVGTALAVIRDDRLYRASHRTFEAYVADKWGWNRSTAYKYIYASDVQATCSDVATLPTIEHGYLLSAFSEGQQRKIAPQVAPLSVRDARKVVKQFRDEVTNTDAVSEAARKEIREALRSDEPTTFFTTWRDASAVMVERMGELPADELVSVATWIKALADKYNATRQARGG